MPKAKEAMPAKVLASGVAYMLSSIFMLLLNKSVMSKFSFTFNATVLMMQGFMTIAVLLLCNWLGIIKLQPLDLKVAKQWVPVNLLFICMLFTSFKTLHHLAVPVVTIFKNVANVFTMLGAWFLFREVPTPGVAVSVGLCVLGAVLSGVSEINPNASGYAWVVLNCLSTAAYVLYMRANVTLKLSVFEKALYNNVLMVPTVSVLALLLGEWPDAFQAEQWSSASFIVALLLSGGIGFLLNMASIWCVDVNGATTYAMIGAVNKVPVTFIGYFLFDEVISSKQWMFVIFSLAAGCLYAYAKSQSSASSRPSPQPPQPEEETPLKPHAGGIAAQATGDIVHKHARSEP